MRLTIRRTNSRYELSFGHITQFCGTNVVLKSYIINSICKHFSSEKYRDYEDILIDNIEIDGEVPGRKQWECYRISNVESIISAIQVNKVSILGKCLKEYVGEFDCQNKLMQIDAILLEIFNRLNRDIFDNKSVEIQYSQEDLFGMLQQTSIKTKEGSDIHVLNNEELLNLFLDIVEKQQIIIPEKRLYIFENIDHLVEKQAYRTIVSRCESLSKESNIWFIFTTSLDDYIYINEDIIENINIINEGIYVLPSFERLLDFIANNYPTENEWDENIMRTSLCKIVQKIGLDDSMLQPFDLIILKLINETDGIRNYWKSSPKMPEIQCLMDMNVL